MGPFVSLLTKYNEIRKVNTAIVVVEKMRKPSLNHTLIDSKNFLLGVLFIKPDEINFSAGSRYGRCKLLTLMVKRLSPIFFFEVPVAEFTPVKKKRKSKKNEVIETIVIRRTKLSSLRSFLAPLFEDLSDLPRIFVVIRGKRCRGLNKYPYKVIFFFFFLINKFFVTKYIHLRLSLIGGGNVSYEEQMAYYFFKIAVYDYSDIRWGMHFYDQTSSFSIVEMRSYYKHMYLLRARYYADGLLDVEIWNEFAHLQVPKLPPLGGLSPVLKVAKSPYITNFHNTKLESAFFDKLYNKSRYARNRQTYRTGVIWCLWVTIITIFMPSYLYYGINAKFTYLLPFFLGFLFTLAQLYVGKIYRFLVFELFANIVLFFKAVNEYFKTRW